MIHRLRRWYPTIKMNDRKRAVFLPLEVTYNAKKNTRTITDGCVRFFPFSLHDQRKQWK